MSIEKIVFRIALTILIVEAMIMEGFRFFPIEFTAIEETLIDTTLLVLFSTPVIYLWIIKPFVIAKEKAMDNLSYVTYFDEVTGLPNRAKLLDILDYSIHTSTKNETLSIILFDLDRFKAISDSFGHVIANDLINQVAKRLTRSIGDETFITRIGPSSFVFIVEHPESNDTLYLLAKRALETLSLPIVCEPHAFNLEAYIGISSFPKDAINKDDLLKYAHTAMRQAKSNEDEKIHFYTNSLTELVQKHFTIEEEMRRAIENDEFFLLYQPKIDAQTNEMVGVEALIRWNHPEKGVITPIHFIHLAEDSGLITKIGELVLTKAIQQQEIWASEGKKPVIMSINLSGRQLKEEHIDSIIEILNATFISKKLLELEMTETYLMKNPEQSKQLLDRLYKTGISIALDDFGTGYSSLGYLKRFKINVLKMDKILIDDIEHDTNAFAIVKAVVVMAHALGIKVVAEGVESSVQAQMLKNIDCDQFQGYYFAKPLHAEQVFNQSYHV